MTIKYFRQKNETVSLDTYFRLKNVAECYDNLIF